MKKRFDHYSVKDDFGDTDVSFVYIKKDSGKRISIGMVPNEIAEKIISKIEEHEDVPGWTDTRYIVEFFEVLRKVRKSEKNC